MRKALVVGIDYYSQMRLLHGCVSDAGAMKAVLGRHGDGAVNFAVRTLLAPASGEVVTREMLRDAVRELFAYDAEVALLYFAGHGSAEGTGGYLCTSDSHTGSEGVPLSEVLMLANTSRARNKVLILDSCRSGIAGTNSMAPQYAELAEELTILAASTAEQRAVEQNGRGVFTTLLVDALSGAAGNLMGDITPGSVYAHIDQSLGPWEQRPVWKANIKSFISLRKAKSPIELTDLQRLPEFFPVPEFELQLDPSFAVESDTPHEGNVVSFQILQRYNRVNLVVPVGATHMWHAAMQSKRCRLTVLGEHYRRLVALGRI